MFCPSFDGQEELAVCTDICQDLRTFEFAESKLSKLLHHSVKGRLKASIEFWRFIGAPKFILDIISNGYKIPFITTPPPVHLKNNGSALEHSDFVNDAILELLQDNRIEELTTPPEIINPLTVSVQRSGKKRLILDLRHINLHVFKQKFKCEGLHTIRDIFSEDYFVFLLISNLDTTMWIFFRIIGNFWHFRGILALIALDTFNLLCCHSVFPARLSFLRS